MCICSVHEYGGKFTYPTSTCILVIHVTEVVYAQGHFSISALIAIKPNPNTRSMLFLCSGMYAKYLFDARHGKVGFYVATRR